MKNEAQYLLFVQPETDDQPWHATLERVYTQNCDRVAIELLEFTSPIALAQHLATVGLENRLRRGLR
jgi:hypothetical protein